MRALILALTLGLMSLGTLALTPSRTQAQELRPMVTQDTAAVRWYRDGWGRWHARPFYRGPAYWSGYPVYGYYSPSYYSYYPGFSPYVTWPGYSAYYPPPTTPYYGTYYYGW
jgi:hypothetical protein